MNGFLPPAGRFMPRTLLLATCLLGPVAPAMAAEKVPASNVTRVPMVAVLPFTAQSLTPDARDGLSANLASELLRTGKFRVMERSQMDVILKEQGFQQSGACSGDQCAVEMGKLLAVDAMVLGTVAKVGETYTLNARLVNVQSGEVMQSVSRNSRANVDVLLTDVVPAVALDLAKIKPKSNLGWWIAGGVAVAGGATAAVLLLKGDAKATTATPVTPVVTTPTNTEIQVTLP
jgi:TolB-like protein